MSISKSDRIFQQLFLRFPNPETELSFASEFQLLIAVILSAQSTDAAVNKVTKILFAVAPDPKSMIDLGEKKIGSIIKTLGLFNNKARNIFKCSQQLISDHQAKVPDDRQSLEKLAGVGRKTAGVVLNVAFKQPTIPVDTHVFRVANRIGLVDCKSVKETEEKLMQTVSSKFQGKAHHLLILQGRYVCKARKPLCSDCTLAGLCQYYAAHQNSL